MAAKRRQHKRTESQAVTELENVFKSVDLEGNGKLDYASFQTAMFSLDVMMDDEKMNELYKTVDTEDTGEIDYDQFLDFLKNGQLASVEAAQEILDGAKAAPSSVLPSKSNTQPVTDGVPAPAAPAAPVKAPPKKKMDPKKKSVIQRAVIVIKKAAMKNISREEVVEFLKDKGLKNDDINYAYEKAQEQAMSPEERIRYLKTQITSKEKELKDQKAFARHLSDQNAEKNDQIQRLQACVEKAAQHMLTLAEPKPAKSAPKEVATEITNYAKKLMDRRATLTANQQAIIDKDVVRLNNMNTCLKDGKAIAAYLFWQSTEAVDRSALAITSSLMEEMDS